MLTVAIICNETGKAGALCAALYQTGSIASVVEWPLSGDVIQRIDSPANVPHIVFLLLDRDSKPFFAAAAHLRLIQPAVWIAACSRQSQTDPEVLLLAMRSGVQDFVSPDVAPQELQQMFTRFTAEARPSASNPAAKTTVVVGAKGGVGTSTVVVNLAAQMALSAKRRVILLDLARPIGHVSLLLDLRPKFTVRDAITNLERLDGHFMKGLLAEHKSGLSVLCGVTQPGEWPAPDFSAITRVVNVARTLCDAVVIDAGAVSLAEWLPLVQDGSNVLLVTETNVPALWAVEKSLTTLGAAARQANHVRVVVNRWMRKDDETLKAFEKNAKLHVFARLSNDFQQVCEATNQGQPLSRNHNNALVTQYQQLACSLAGVPNTANADKKKGLLRLTSLR